MLPHSSSLGSAGPAGRPGRRRPRSAWRSVACGLAILGTAALTLGSGAPSSSSRTLWPTPASRLLGSARQPSSRTIVVPVPHRPSTTTIPVPSGRGRLWRTVLRDQGPIGRPGTARPISAGDLRCPWNLRCVLGQRLREPGDALIADEDQRLIGEVVGVPDRILSAEECQHLLVGLPAEPAFELGRVRRGPSR